MKTNIHFWSYLAQFFLRNKEKCFRQICWKNQVTAKFNNFYSENRALYEIKWNNVIEWYWQLDNVLRHKRFGCWISKATNTQYKYVILIAFPLLQRLFERASFSGYTCSKLPVLLFSCAFYFYQIPVSTKDTICRLVCEVCH